MRTENLLKPAIILNKTINLYIKKEDLMAKYYNLDVYLHFRAWDVEAENEDNAVEKVFKENDWDAEMYGWTGKVELAYEDNEE